MIVILVWLFFWNVEEFFFFIICSGYLLVCGLFMNKGEIGYFFVIDNYYYLI